MKRLFIVAALLAVAACKTNDTGKTTTTDTTSTTTTTTTTPAMAPAPDTSAKMNMDTGMKAAGGMADSMAKKGKAAMKKSM